MKTIKRTFMYLAVIILILFLVIGLTLQRNQAKLGEPPGFVARLKLFLRINSAEVSETPRLPELKSPRYPLPPESLLIVVIEAMQQLGWEEIRQVKPGVGAKAMVVTPLLRFKDDVSVTIEAEGDGSLLKARSQSRVGRGDFAANSAHLQLLLTQISKNIETSGD